MIEQINSPKVSDAYVSARWSWTAAALIIFGAHSFTAVYAEPAVVVMSQAQAAMTPQQRADQLKAWLKESQEQIKGYEWVETTVISVDGKEKSKTQEQCYYGVDGKLQKVPVGGDSKKSSGGIPGILLPGRLFRAIEKNKSKEDAEYMQQASKLIHTYLPPSPDLIQHSISAGNMSVNVLQPGKRDRLDFANYKKTGDKLGVEIDLITNRLLAIHVTTYMDDQQHVVTLEGQMRVLPDGTIYVQKTTLNAPAKKMTVSTESTGFHRSGN